METSHRDRCEANICADGITEEEKETLPWYPDEEICGKSPMTKWQRKQRRIAKYVKRGVFKFMDFYFTANMLEKASKVTKTMKGKDPNIPIGETRSWALR